MRWLAILVFVFGCGNDHAASIDAAGGGGGGGGTADAPADAAQSPLAFSCAVTNGSTFAPNPCPAPSGTSGEADFCFRPQWPGVTSVDVYGGFGQATDWTQPFVSLANDGSGTYTGTATVANGSYPYVFRVHGTYDNLVRDGQYLLDQNNASFVPAPAQAPGGGGRSRARSRRSPCRRRRSSCITSPATSCTARSRSRASRSTSRSASSPQRLESGRRAQHGELRGERHRRLVRVRRRRRRGDGDRALSVLPERPAAPYPDPDDDAVARLRAHDAADCRRGLRARPTRRHVLRDRLQRDVADRRHRLAAADVHAQRAADRADRDDRGDHDGRRRQLPRTRARRARTPR